MKRLIFWALASSALFAHSTSTSLAEERAAVRVPELSRRQLPEPFCVVNVTLTDTEPDQRKTTLLAFIRRSYVATDLWMRDFVPLNIDYSKFMSLDLIYYRHCSKLKQIDVYKAMPDCEGSEAKCFKPENTKASIGGTTPALGEPNITTGGEHDLIERYMGQDRLSQCSIKIPIKKTPNLTEALLVNGDIRKLQLKYVLPIMMTSFRNDDVYIILSRNCEAAVQIYGLIIELLKLEGPESSASLLTPIFYPDMSEYWRSISKAKPTPHAP